MTSKIPRINRRTALKTIGVAVVGSAGMSSNAVAQPPEVPPPEHDEPTWGSDGTDHWQILATDEPTPSGGPAHRPLYGIAPANGTHSPHSPSTGHAGFAHDHVVDTPGSGRAFTAEWHPFFVCENPESIFTALNTLVNKDDKGNFITTVRDIEDAEKKGDVEFFDPGEEAVFTCPIRPHNPTDED